MLYLIDANVLMTAHNTYYAIDAVPEFWTWLVHHGSAGRIKIPREIFAEVKDGGTDKEKDILYDWVQDADNKDAILLKEDVDPTLVRKVTEEGYAVDLNDVEIEKIGRDPFLIAYALASPADRLVVTTEVSKPSKQRANRQLPDVCKLFGITCIDTFQLTKALRFSTNWDGSEKGDESR
jgi:hypothetical protein